MDEARDEKIAGMPYRPCVGIMLVNDDGRVWMGRRVPKWERDGGPDLWQMPQGGIDEGENPRDAAFRELYEEIGTRKVRIAAESADWLKYDLPREVIGHALGGNYRGQTQKWFLMHYEGDDSEFNLTSDGDHEVEFDDWGWFEIDEVAERVVDFKREVYERVIAEFRPHIMLIACR